jgi:hypothetical protein
LLHVRNGLNLPEVSRRAHVLSSLVGAVNVFCGLGK